MPLALRLTNFSRRLARTADSLLPDAITANQEHRLRGYLLLALLFTNIVSCVLALPVYLFMLESTPPGLGAAIGVDLLCLSGYLYAYYLLTRRGKFKLAADITFAVLLGVNMLTTQLTGGFIESPLPQLTLFTPLFAFVLFGIKRGALWLSATIGLCLFSLILAKYDLLSIQLIPNIEDRQTLEVLFFFLLIFMGTTALIFNDRMYQNLHRKLREERDSYVYQAGHDMLTGLPNRFQFFEFFEKTLNRAARKGQTLALGYIDLDGFKPINDNFGHHTGDIILETVASRLTSVIRNGDMVARFGGDEFTLLIPTVVEYKQITGIIERLVAALSQEIEVDGVIHAVTASVGVALFPQHGRTVDELCQKADAALYKAKQENNTYRFYEGVEYAER